MKPSMTLAANAIPGAGGQGLNLQQMYEAMAEVFDVTLYCRAVRHGAPGHAVPQSRLADMLRRTPLLRRARDFQIYRESISFDSYVSGRLAPGCKVFQGVTGQCHASLRAARKMGALAVVDSVTTHIDQFVESQARECARFGIRPAISSALHQLTLREYECADYIRVMSEPARRSFLERGIAAEKVVVAHPPYEVAAFPEATFPCDAFRVCFVGLIEPWKGFHYLVEAFERAAIPASELVLYGGSGSRPVSRYLEAAMARMKNLRVRAEEVRRLGYGNVYGQAHVLVHPSLSDGFGYVVAEAMASGIPVIVTAETGASELVEDGVTGYIVPSRQSDPIVDRLRYLADRPELVRQMGAAARKRIHLHGDGALRRYAQRLLQMIN